MIDESAVEKVQDFRKEDVYDEEGDVIPKAGMLVVEIAGGRRFAVRTSGTEPKIKYYLFGKGAPGAQDLNASKERVKAELQALWSWLEADAHRRMERTGVEELA